MLIDLKKDDSDEPTPQEKAMLSALMHGTGVLAYEYKDGEVKLKVVPAEEYRLEPPGTTQ
jgi:hypothetical protein